MNLKEKMASKKFWFVFLIVMLASFATFIPPIISIWLAEPLIILTGAQWVTISSLSISTYAVANVWQKKITNQPIEPEVEEFYDDSDEDRQA